MILYQHPELAATVVAGESAVTRFRFFLRKKSDF